MFETLPEYFFNRKLLNETFRELLRINTFGNELQTMLEFCIKRNLANGYGILQIIVILKPSK